MAFIPIERTSCLDSAINIDRLSGAMFTQENEAHQFVITCTQNNAQLTLTGTITAKVVLANGNTVELVGTIDGGKAVVTLTQPCYNTAGRIQISIFNTVGSTKLCIYAAIAYVQTAEHGDLIDGSQIIDSVEDLIADIQAAVATIPPDYSILSNQVADLKSAFDDIAIVVNSKNLLNPNAWAVGKNINTSGNIVDAPTRVLSDFIPVTPGKTYYFAALTADERFFAPSDKKIVGCGFFTDADASAFMPNTVESYVGQRTAPENANYMLLSFPTNYLTQGAGTPIISVTEDWYPATADDLVPWAEPATVLVNQDQVDQNTAKLTAAEKKVGLIEKRSCTVRTVSHQGYKVNVPKSTKWAYIAAKQHGFEIAENDINFSAQSGRTLFMWHDATFSVCGDIIDADHGYALYTDGTDYYWYDTGNEALYNLDYELVSGGSISGMTRVAGSSLQCTSTPWKLIKEIDVGAYYGNGQFAGTKVQTFEEWVLLCKQLGLEMYVDRKVNTEYFISDLVGIVKKHGMLDHTTWIINVTATIGQAIRAIDPNARLLLLTRPTAEQLPAIADLAQSGRGVVYGFANSSTSAETVAEAIENGIAPEGYFVGYESLTKDEVFAEIRRLIELGCTGLTIDEYFAEEAYGYLYDELNAKLT